MKKQAIYKKVSSIKKNPIYLYLLYLFFFMVIPQITMDLYYNDHSGDLYALGFIIGGYLHHRSKK